MCANLSKKIICYPMIHKRMLDRTHFSSVLPHLLPPYPSEPKSKKLSMALTGVNFNKFGEINATIQSFNGDKAWCQILACVLRADKVNIKCSMQNIGQQSTIYKCKIILAIYLSFYYFSEQTEHKESILKIVV